MLWRRLVGRGGQERDTNDATKATNASRNDTLEKLPGTKDVRALWYNCLDGEITADERSRALEQMKKIFGSLVEEGKNFRKGPDHYLHHDEYPDTVTNFVESKTKLENQYNTREINAIPEGAIVIPVMASGLPYGAAVFAKLSEDNKKPEYALMGYSHVGNPFGLRGLHDAEPRSSIDDAVFVPEEYHSFLKKNKDKVVVLAEDYISKGTTIAIMINALLRDFGFKNDNIYVMTNADSGLGKYRSGQLSRVTVLPSMDLWRPIKTCFRRYPVPAPAPELQSAARG